MLDLPHSRLPIPFVWFCLVFQIETVMFFKYIANNMNSWLPKTHCQIRPILIFIFSIFHFFSEVKNVSFKWSVLDFIVFPKRFCPIETKNSTFQSYKNTHFSWLIAQILYKNENPILERNFICKVCTIVLENWAFLWLWKVLFLVSMGQNLLGKIII